MIVENPEGRELWWIFSPMPKPWANLRVATFFKATNSGIDLLIIHNEVGDRVGVRDWETVRDKEHWVKIKKIELPSSFDLIKACMEDDERVLRGD